MVTDEKSNKKKKFPIRRGNKKSLVNNEFTIVGVNAAGIKTKFKSFKHIIDSVNASCFVLQETKLKRKGWLKLELDGFQIFKGACRSFSGNTPFPPGSQLFIEWTNLDQTKRFQQLNP